MDSGQGQNGEQKMGPIGVRPVFSILSGPEGMTFQTALPPQALLSLLLGALEEVRQQCMLIKLAEIAAKDKPRIELVGANQMPPQPKVS